MVMLKSTGRSSTAVTIRTVAEQAGVSMMTVSNVINGTGKVSDQTRARVRQAIRNTGYVPNYEARRLASGGCSRMAFPMVSLMFAWGGSEGHHNILNMNTSLLGASARPSLN